MKAPKPFQLEGAKRTIDFLLHGPANAAYNGSDPGVGKTLTTLLAIKEMGFKKVLIICPKAMLYTWKREIESWTPDYHPDVIEETKHFKKLIAGRSKQIYIIAYSLIWRDGMANHILRSKFDCMVMDEAHMLSDKKAYQTRFILRDLWKKVPYRIALSGTPFTSCITQCYEVFSRMLPNFFGGRYVFADAFAIAQKSPWGTKYSGIQNADKLSKIIRKNFFFRYKRDDVLKDLPKRQYTQITLPKKYSCKAYEKLLEELEKEGTDVTELPDIPVHMMGEIRLQGELKVEIITEYAKGLLDQNIPIIIFTINKSVLALYKKNLESFNPLIIDGDTLVIQKEKNIEDFQKGVSNLIIINYKAGGLGITLTRAQYVLLSQLPFNPTDIEQAVSRANRMGANEQTNISYFVVEKSLDEKISARILQKLKDFNELFN